MGERCTRVCPCPSQESSAWAQRAELGFCHLPPQGPGLLTIRPPGWKEGSAALGDSCSFASSLPRDDAP